MSSMHEVEYPGILTPKGYELFLGIMWIKKGFSFMENPRAYSNLIYHDPIEFKKMVLFEDDKEAISYE